MIALVFFSSVSYALENYGFLAFSLLPNRAVRPGHPMDLYAHLPDFYIWHFLEAIPLLEVNKTLRWEEPLKYTKVGVGWMLLLFKITVIIPVIAAFAGY